MMDAQPRLRQGRRSGKDEGDGMRALFIGGNGVISADCSRLAVERGWELTLLNRGVDSTRPPVAGVESLVGDVSDPASVDAAV